MKSRSVEKLRVNADYDAGLERLQDQDLFPEKTALAKSILTKAELPVNRKKFTSSSSK